MHKKLWAILSLTCALVCSGDAMAMENKKEEEEKVESSLDDTNFYTRLSIIVKPVENCNNGTSKKEGEFPNGRTIMTQKRKSYQKDLWKIRGDILERLENKYKDLDNQLRKAREDLALQKEEYDAQTTLNMQQKEALLTCMNALTCSDEHLKNAQKTSNEQQKRLATQEKELSRHKHALQSSCKINNRLKIISITEGVILTATIVVLAEELWGGQHLKKWITALLLRARRWR